MKLKLLLVPVVALVGLLGASAVATHAEVDPPLHTYNLNVGGGGSGIAANDFFPDSITIHKGDTIHFANPYAEIHTVTFLPPATARPPLIIPDPNGGPGMVFNPLASNPTNAGSGATTFDPHAYYNSGILQMNGAADITFNTLSDQNADVTIGSEPNPGEFTIVCLVHPNMILSVNVVPDPQDVPSQADIDKEATAQRDALIATGSAFAAAVHPSRTVAADGKSTWNMLAGTTLGDADIMQFLPQGTASITVGDTVKWSSITDTPHTITFLNGAPVPSFVQPEDNGVLGFNPAVVLPSGGATYDGSSPVNSGIIDSTGAFPAGTSFSLTFTKPGTYTYLCEIHADQNMMGTIVVSGAAPAVSAPPPAVNPAGNISGPNTGTGPDPQHPGSWLIAGLLVLAGGLALAGASRAARKDEI